MNENEEARRIQQLLGVIMLVVVAVIVVLMTTVRFSSSVPSVRATLERGANVMVVRFPESVGQQREELIIRNPPDGPATVSRIYVTTSDQMQRGTYTEVSNDQRAAWTNIRTAWCQQAPRATDTLPVFEIAIRCPRPGGFGRVVEFRITASQLPQELRTLIATVPSPSCKDPLCGW